MAEELHATENVVCWHCAGTGNVHAVPGVRLQHYAQIQIRQGRRRVGSKNNDKGKGIIHLDNLT